MFDFGGERVVITGASGGVGQALVEVFSELDAAVVACDVEGADLPKDRIAEAHHFDLLDEPALETACAQILVNGPPAAVVSNAGWTRAETLEDVTAEALAVEMDLNFKSAASLSKMLIPAMRGRPEGASFVFVSSVNANAHFGNPVYAAAKASCLTVCPMAQMKPTSSRATAVATLPGGFW